MRNTAIMIAFLLYKLAVFGAGVFYIYMTLKVFMTEYIPTVNEIALAYLITAITMFYIFHNFTLEFYDDDDEEGDDD